MAGEQHRHDINDRAWEKIRPYTISEKGTRGGNARDTRQFINGVDISVRIKPEREGLPKRCLAWFNNFRRLSKDFEISVHSAQTACSIAAFRTLLNRFQSIGTTS